MPRAVERIEEKFIATGIGSNLAVEVFPKGVSILCLLNGILRDDKGLHEFCAPLIWSGWELHLEQFSLEGIFA